MLNFDASISPRKYSIDRSTWTIWWIFLAINIFVVLGLGVSTNLRTTGALITPGAIEWAPADSGAQSLPDEAAWKPYEKNVAAMNMPAYFLRLTYNQNEQLLHQPSILLSGAFSAKVWVNGEPVGSKGEFGLSKRKELPGSIDSIIRLGDGLLPGKNEVIIGMSSFHTTSHHAKFPIHRIGFQEYATDARRNIKQYLVAGAQIGLLISIAGFLFYLYASRSLEGSLWLAFAAISAVLAFAAETSRAFINYNYSWHDDRQFAVWAFLFLFGAALNIGAAKFHRTAKWPIYFACAGAILSVFTIGIAGQISSISLSFFLFGLLFIGVSATAKSPKSGIALIATIPPWIAFAYLFPGDFIDNGIYVFATIALQALIVAQPQLDTQTPNPAQTKLEQNSKNASVKINIDGQVYNEEDILALHAAGNYVEIEFNGGNKKLIRGTLSAILKTTPESFVRVHRSHVVNINHALHIRSEPGSRYHVGLNNGAKYPVSRTQVQSLRAAISN